MRTRALRRAVAASWLALAALPPALPAAAAERATLRGDVEAEHDTLTLGDLVANAPDKLAAKPLFRSPVLGQTGTIQAGRVAEAAAALGVPVETGGRLQILVTRASRQVGTQEIETATMKALELRTGLDPRTIGVVFDGAPPRLTHGARRA